MCSELESSVLRMEGNLYFKPSCYLLSVQLTSSDFVPLRLTETGVKKEKPLCRTSLGHGFGFGVRSVRRIPSFEQSLLGTAENSLGTTGFF